MLRPSIRFLYPYGKPRTVLRGPARGMRFVVEPGIGFSYALGVEAACPRFLSSQVRPGETVYDIGANKGQMSLLFARRVGPSGCVLAFEPVPEEHESLCRNLRLNGLDWVEALPLAVSDAAGRATFTYASDRPTQGKLAGVEPTYVNEGAGTFEVETVTLDGLLEKGLPAPDLLKIDVEGAAAAVLRGAARLLEERSPRIYLDLHGPEEQAGVRDELLPRGYVAETVDGEAVADPTAQWRTPLWCYRKYSRAPASQET